MSLYESTVPQFIKMLRGVDRWLDAAEAYAKQKSFDPAVLLQARLAPDQYPLVRQVQAACDTAKFAGARLTAGEAPKHPDAEQTVDELKQRVRACAGYLESLTPADFEGAEARKVVLPFAPGKFIRGADYVADFALPNFYFHVTTAYAILRHNGVALGKGDFLGSLALRDG